jgi:hypothetical protein
MFIFDLAPLLRDIFSRFNLTSFINDGQLLQVVSILCFEILNCIRHA